MFRRAKTEKLSSFITPRIAPNLKDVQSGSPTPKQDIGFSIAVPLSKRNDPNNENCEGISEKFLPYKFQCLDRNQVLNLPGTGTYDDYFNSAQKSLGSCKLFQNKELNQSYKSFNSDKYESENEMNNLPEDHKPASMYNMETAFSLGLNSPTTSDSVLQNCDTVSSENSFSNSPKTQKADRVAHQVYKKSKFFNQKEILQLPDDDEEFQEENKSEDHTKNQTKTPVIDNRKTTKHMYRKSMLPFPVLPVIKSDNYQDYQVNTEQTEALIQLKKSISKKKRLINLYEVLKSEGKLITDQDISQKSTDINL